MLKEFLISNWPSLLILLAGLIGAFGVFVSSQQQNQLNTELKNLQKRNVGLTENLIKNQDSLQKAQTENLNLAKENSKLAKELAEAISGGDTYLILGQMLGSLTVHAIGDIPLRNVDLHIGHDKSWLTVNYNGKTLSEFSEKEKAVYFKKNIDIDFYTKIQRIPYTKGGTQMLIKLPEMKPLDTKLFSYNWKAYNGSGHGQLWVHMTKDGTILTAQEVLGPDRNVYYHPKNYARVKNSALPKWENFN